MSNKKKRDRTEYFRKYDRMRQNKIREKWYSNLFCDFCGSEKNVVFHHINPENKKYTISLMKSKHPLIFLSEMAKCIVLCNSCHTTFHNKQKGKVMRVQIPSFPLRC